MITNYPGFPVVTNLSRSSAITRNLKAFIPIFASSLELMPELRSGKGPITAESRAPIYRDITKVAVNVQLALAKVQTAGSTTVAFL